MAKVLYDRAEGSDFGRRVRVTVIYLGTSRDRWYLMESGILHVKAEVESWHNRQKEVIPTPWDLEWANLDAYAIHVGIARWKSLLVIAKGLIESTDIRLYPSKKGLLAAIDKREACDPLRG